MYQWRVSEEETVSQTLRSAPGAPSELTARKGTTKRRPRLRGRFTRRWIELGLALSLTYAIEVHRLDGERQRVLAGLGQLGVLVDRPLPKETTSDPKRNAALRYSDLLRANDSRLVRMAEDSAEEAHDGFGTILSPVMARVLRPALLPKLNAIKRASDLDTCVWLDETRPVGRELSMMDYGELLCYEAREAAENGRVDQALQEYVRALRVARHVGTYPSRYGRAVQGGMEISILRSFLRTVRLPAFGPKELRKAHDVLMGMGDLPDVRSLLAGEIQRNRLALVGPTGWHGDLLRQNRLVQEGGDVAYLTRMLNVTKRLPRNLNDTAGIQRAVEGFYDETGLRYSVLETLSDTYRGSTPYTRLVSIRKTLELMASVRRKAQEDVANALIPGYQLSPTPPDLGSESAFFEL